MSVACHVHAEYQPWCLLCLGASTKALQEEEEPPEGPHVETPQEIAWQVARGEESVR